MTANCAFPDPGCLAYLARAKSGGKGRLSEFSKVGELQVMHPTRKGHPWNTEEKCSGSGARVARLVKHQPLILAQVMISRFESEPHIGLPADSAEPPWGSLPPSLSSSLSLRINKLKKRKGSESKHRRSPLQGGILPQNYS